MSNEEVVAQRVRSDMIFHHSSYVDIGYLCELVYPPQESYHDLAWCGEDEEPEVQARVLRDVTGLLARWIHVQKRRTSN